MKEIELALWHAQESGEVLARLEVNTERGLDNDEVAPRRAAYGANVFKPPRRETAFMRFLLQFHQPLIYILLASGVVSLVLGEYTDCAVIFAVVMLNGLVGYFQEAGALRALEALKKSLSTQATVLRGGQKHNLLMEELVVGDIVFLQSGDKVPADLRLFSQKELQVNESSLTGESLPVSKDIAALAPDTVLADRRNMVYASTYITRGQGAGIVVSVGEKTEIGNISRLIREVPSLSTPLGKKMDAFGNKLLYVILAMALATFLFGWLRGQEVAELLMVAVALAVGAIPEGLPAAITTILAVGVYRMARRNAIVRKLPVVETLGSTTVICSDKTGTLTENQMTVHFVYAGFEEFEVSGSGYQPQGEIKSVVRQQIAALADQPALKQCLLAGLHCNDSRVRQKDGQYFVEGDPTEGALLVSAQKAGLTEMELLPRLDSIPFESERQYMATLHAQEGEGNIIFLKGAVDRVLATCTEAVSAQGEIVVLDNPQILEENEHLAGEGERVLALAMKSTSAHHLEEKDIQTGFIFLGLQSFIDPPRREAIEAIKVCRQAGMQVKMITGDHAVTARAIAERLNLAGEGQTIKVLEGRELTEIPEVQFATQVLATDVFARVSPEQKLQLVRAIQSQNQIVAMTGDGVNDAPALKQADIGIAMGITGTEVSKEAADMVLTDDNFRTIQLAVEQGRMIFDNLLKFIVWTLPTNMGQGTVIMMSIFAGWALPILPVQILWINLTTAGILGLTLAFEPQEPGLMQRQPRNPQAALISKTLFLRMLLISLVLVLASFLLFHLKLQQGASPAAARTAAVTVFILVELFFLFNCRSLYKPIWALSPWGNPWVWAGSGLMLLVQAFYIYHPTMHQIFDSAPLLWADWVLLLGVGLGGFFLIEFEKTFAPLPARVR
ncbi:MAG: cation-transporting P-type ATPase [Microscillaceae bacterium]